MEDVVFRAIADPSRRRLLDFLRRKDGQTLTELEQRLPMTRFGVMKHLNVLEEAHLVVTRKLGREKYHYLNPVPIQRISDRWISRYAAPFVQMIGGIKSQLEEGVQIMFGEQPRHVFEVYIRASAPEVWDAVVNGEKTRLYNRGMTLVGDIRKGGKYEFFDDSGRVLITGDVLEARKPHKLVLTFHAKWSPDVAAERPSRCTWEIVEMGEVSKVTLVHEDFEADSMTSKGVANGWPMTLSGLKTLLETGLPLALKIA